MAGLVRAPIATTALQVVSRFVLVWFIAKFFPESTAASPAFTSMLLAWSVTEIIRYSYFALYLRDGEVPETLTWLRYSAFFVLYPLGIASECWLIFKATPAAAAWHWSVAALLWVVLACYVPGEFSLTRGWKSGCMLMCVVFRLIHSIHTHDGSEEQGNERKEGFMMRVTLFMRALNIQNRAASARLVGNASMSITHSPS